MSYYFRTNIVGILRRRRFPDNCRPEGGGFRDHHRNRPEGDVQRKLGVDFRRYKILGACNPNLAFEALKLEGKVGTMLPCNVIVQERSAGQVEVAAIDPVASMQAIGNPALAQKAQAVRQKLQSVINRL